MCCLFFILLNMLTVSCTLLNCTWMSFCFCTSSLFKNCKILILSPFSSHVTRYVHLCGTIPPKYEMCTPDFRALCELNSFRLNLRMPNLKLSTFKKHLGVIGRLRNGLLRQLCSSRTAKDVKSVQNGSLD